MGDSISGRRFRILCPEPRNFSQRGIAAAGRLAQLDALNLSQSEFEKLAGSYNAFMVRLSTRITSHVIAASRDLRAIITPTTGLDHIDLEAAHAKRIELFCLRGENDFLRTVTSTAEHTWALLLCAVRRIVPAQETVKRNRWRQDSFRSRELSGKTLGILGLGRLGTMIAGYGLAFGMRVVAHDPYVTTCPDGVALVKRLDDLLSASDIVTIHLHLKEDTIGLIGPRELGLLPRGAYVVNTSRGLIVDEHALLAALETGQLAGAAVDVVTNEASVFSGTHPMIQYAATHENLLITPHIGGASQDAIEKTDLFVMEKLERWLETQPSR